jgi:hypothetical protein
MDTKYNGLALCLTKWIVPRYHHDENGRLNTNVVAQPWYTVQFDRNYLTVSGVIKHCFIADGKIKLWLELERGIIEPVYLSEDEKKIDDEFDSLFSD